MRGRFGGAGDLPALMKRCIAPAPAAAIDEPLDIARPERLACRQQAYEAHSSFRDVLPGKSRDGTVGKYRILTAHDHLSVAGVGRAGPASEEDRTLVGFSDEFEEAVSALSRLYEGDYRRKSPSSGGDLYHCIDERIQYRGQLAAGKFREDRYGLANRKGAGGRRCNACPPGRAAMW